MPLGIKDLFSGARDLINHPDEFVQVLSALSLGWRVGGSLCACASLSLTESPTASAD